VVHQPTENRSTTDLAVNRLWDGCFWEGGRSCSVRCGRRALYWIACPASTPLRYRRWKISVRSVSFGAHGQHEALGEAVRPRATWRVGGDPDVRDYMLTRLTARLHAAGCVVGGRVGLRVW